VTDLFQRWEEKGLVTRDFYHEKLASKHGPGGTKYSTDPDDLLRESAFCLIPAAPIAHYLDTDPITNPCMTVNHIGDWSVIVEGANTYSPDPDRQVLRSRMERAVYRGGGVLIATDYLVNSGGVIYAAQEHLIKTPGHLRIPEEMLGDRAAVDRWLAKNAADLAELAQKRLKAAEEYRDDAIRANMRELVTLLTSDADMLPYEAAERISIRRIASRESDRTVADIMDPIPTISADSPVQEAASLLVASNSSILAVVGESGELVGVLTEWDITRATARNAPNDAPLAGIMTRHVVTASPDDGFLEVIRSLEHHSISAMPVVGEDGAVLGKISFSLLAKRSLFRLLQSEGNF
jgi:glutamate dehydrogenase (NAD(P)+)